MPWLWQSSASGHRKARFLSPYIGIISFWKSHDEVMDICVLCRLYNLIHRCSGFPIFNIFLYTSAEQIHILLYNSNTAAQRWKHQISHILPIYFYTSLCHIIEARQEVANSGFSRSGWFLRGQLNALPVPGTKHVKVSRFYFPFRNGKRHCHK